MNRVSDEALRETAGLDTCWCPTCRNATLAARELLLARQVIERAGHLIRIQECTHSPSEWVHAVSGLDAALRDYDARFPQTASEGEP